MLQGTEITPPPPLNPAQIADSSLKPMVVLFCIVYKMIHVWSTLLHHNRYQEYRERGNHRSILGVKKWGPWQLLTSQGCSENWKRSWTQSFASAGDPVLNKCELLLLLFLEFREKEEGVRKYSKEELMFTWTGMVTVLTKWIGWETTQDVDLRGCCNWWMGRARNHKTRESLQRFWPWYGGDKDRRLLLNLISSTQNFTIQTILPSFPSDEPICLHSLSIWLEQSWFIPPSPAGWTYHRGISDSYVSHFRTSIWSHQAIRAIKPSRPPPQSGGFSFIWLWRRSLPFCFGTWNYNCTELDLLFPSHIWTESTQWGPEPVVTVLEYTPIKISKNKSVGVRSPGTED